MPNELDEMCHMWDGTEQWILLRCRHEQIVVTIRFGGQSPSLSEMMRLRQLLPKYRELPPAEVKRRLQGRDRLVLEPMHPAEAKEIAKQGQHLGLTVGDKTVSWTSHMPFHPKDSAGDTSICLIEDDALAARVAAAMIEAGVPVYDEPPGEV